jgi:hypothetical protein
MQTPSRPLKRKGPSSGDIKRLRAELEWSRSCYDAGAVCGAVFNVVKEIETDLSWLEHGRQSYRFGMPKKIRIPLDFDFSVLAQYWANPGASQHAN